MNFEKKKQRLIEDINNCKIKIKDLSIGKIQCVDRNLYMRIYRYEGCKKELFQIVGLEYKSNRKN